MSQDLARVDTLLELGRHKEALEALASSEDQASGAVHCRRARALLGLGQLKEAASAAAEACAAEPGGEWGFRLAAIVARRRNRLRDASELIREAVRLAPWEANVHQVANLVAIDLGDKTGATHHAQTMLELAPNEASSHLAMARARILQGYPRTAEEPLRQALAIDPQNDEAMALLADVIGQRDKHGATELRVAAVRANPQDADRRKGLLTTGGIVGGTALTVGKLGLLTKLAFIGSLRHVIGVDPGDGAFAVLIVMLVSVYLVAFGVTRVNRSRHGKRLPPLAWEGLRAERRNADLLWLVTPAALTAIVALIALAVQVPTGRGWGALTWLVPALLLLAVTWSMRAGQARDLTLKDVATNVSAPVRFLIERRLAKRRLAALDRESWVRGPRPSPGDRWERGAVLIIAAPFSAFFLTVGLVALTVTLGWDSAMFTGFAWALSAMAIAGLSAALLDHRDREGRSCFLRVVLEGTDERPSRSRLALRGVVRLVLFPLTMTLVVGRSRQPVRLLHDRVVGTDVITLVPAVLAHV